MLSRRMGCSFCGRSHSDVEKLVAGPMRMLGRVFICYRCAVQTVQIMEGRSGGDQPNGGEASVLRQVRQAESPMIAR